MTVVLPFDGSAVARAALRRLAEPAYRRWVRGQVLLVLPPATRCSVQRRRSEARYIAGPALVLRFRLATGDAATVAQRLADAKPATFVAPVPAHGASGWYRALAGAFLTGTFGRSVALHLDERDLARCPHTPMPPRWAARRVARRSWLQLHRCNVSATFSGAQEVEP